ncbi:MAG TPA: DUF4382 domain-containing protein [Nitrospirota bacterium]|nr:DUF4382 domain-containing protein [Nitrospirota bacterium]
MRNKNAFICIIVGTVLLIAGVISFNSCGSGGNNGGATSSGTVALYATDCMSDYKQVVATINKVTLINTGSGVTCDALSTQSTVTIDITNLSNVLQLLNVADCPAVPYNRLHIEFAKSVELMDSLGSQATCSFVSYKNEANNVNTLQCAGDTCSLDINGAVNVLANHQTDVALDFNLKDFDVDNFGTSCSVTMKVSPIHAEEFEHLSHPKAITGLVSNLTTSTDTFTLTKHHLSLTTLYSGITSTQQPGLDDLLLRAEQDGLRTQVTTSTFDYANKTIEASQIFVKAEGLVSNLTTSTFTLTYNKVNTLPVDYSKAVVKGTLANNAFAEVKLYGYDGTNFLASRTGVEYGCTEPDDRKKDMDTDD